MSRAGPSTIVSVLLALLILFSMMVQPVQPKIKVMGYIALCRWAYDLMCMTGIMLPNVYVKFKADVPQFVHISLFMTFNCNGAGVSVTTSELLTRV